MGYCFGVRFNLKTLMGLAHLQGTQKDIKGPPVPTDAEIQGVKKKPGRIF
ncbi:hypothetical protein FACS1894110_25270 [Spirochaetia bacterium]|nr:hypothetical protein FACS1894110_25270 [Spirochaetia bacterium]